MPHSRDPAPVPAYWPPSRPVVLLPGIPEALGPAISPEAEGALRCVSIRIPADKRFAVDRAELLAAGWGLNKASCFQTASSPDSRDGLGASACGVF